nr:PREDICTED: follistatin-related protein 1 [Struthio camelus australis]
MRSQPCLTDSPGCVYVKLPLLCCSRFLLCEPWRQRTASSAVFGRGDSRFTEGNGFWLSKRAESGSAAAAEARSAPRQVASAGYSRERKEEPRSKSKICANVFCGAGRECAVTEKGEPTCLCIEQCKPHKRPVCGSNGKTYLNHCELHRDACLTGSKIQVDYDGHCKEKKTENPAASPVVCYQSDRDELRRRVIQWLEAEIIPDGWFSKGSNYSEILDKYFKSFDDGDSRLDSTEFLKFVEQNETAVNITTYMDQETNKLLRGLCVDALIELSDENADWKLSFNEFLKCLSPSFNPPEKKCALEDETYEDGAETQVECNRCVCACGNWVCTAMTCEGKNEKVPGQRRQPEQDLTEEELARYVQELQKHQETAEKTKRMSTKEM